MSIEKQTVFKGVATALITPFYKGEIDYEAKGDQKADSVRLRTLSACCFFVTGSR